MHLFLNTYYYHSWTRLIVKGVKSSIDRVKNVFRIDSILFSKTFNSLQNLFH